MAAPYDQWNCRELIPPPTNFLRINSTAGLDDVDDEYSHRCNCLKSTLKSIYDGKDINGSLLKGELITLSRFLHKNKNSQRSWKLNGLLLRLKKCLERLAETTIHSYAATMLSAWENCPEPPSTLPCLPSRQMLEYLCVSLQGCAKLCVYLATLWEQASLIMIATVHSGMFLRSNLVFLAIVSRVRVLICNFFKSTVRWYDDLITAKSFLPSTNSEWLHQDTQLPTALMKWLGEEANRLTLDVTSSKSVSDVSILDRLFNTSLEISVDAEIGGNRKVTAVSQLQTSAPVTVLDVGEKLSQADLATLLMARSKQPYNHLNPQASGEEDKASMRWKAERRIRSPQRKRSTKEDTCGTWSHVEERQSLQKGNRKRKQKLQVKGHGSKRVRSINKWNIGHQVVDNSFSIISKKRSAVIMKRGRERKSSAVRQIGRATHVRCSMSRGNVHSCASQNHKRYKKLQQHIAKVQQKKRSKSG